MDRGAWWATVHGVTELDMTEHSTAAEIYTGYIPNVDQTKGGP